MLGEEEERFLADLAWTLNHPEIQDPDSPATAILDELVTEYGEDGLMAKLRERLEMGAKQYGILDFKKKRDWRKEKHEEFLDSLFYDWAEFRSGEVA